MAGRIPKIVVVGRSFIDMLMRCEDLPKSGQESICSGFSSVAGGPGPNSAVEASLCDCDVHLITKVGDDMFSHMILDRLRRAKVRTDFVYIAQAMSTAGRFTLVDSDGNNTFYMCPGANKALSPDEITFAPAEQAIAQSDVCLIDGDLPMDTVIEAIRTACMYKTKVILEKEIKINESCELVNLKLPKEFLLVDVFLPCFETFNVLTDYGSGGVHKLKMIGSELVATGFKCAVIKLGAKGTFIIDRENTLHLRGFELDNVERCGCPDAFAGALAASCGAGDRPVSAVRFAAAAGALAGKKYGMAESMVDKEEILELLMQQPD